MIVPDRDSPFDLDSVSMFGGGLNVVNHWSSLSKPRPNSAAPFKTEGKKSGNIRQL